MVAAARAARRQPIGGGILGHRAGDAIALAKLDAEYPQCVPDLSGLNALDNQPFSDATGEALEAVNEV
ncbi:hypothetical protein MRA01_64800 [Methylobacterium radiotolerans]|nr:hypothetical protein MRA01_64800 [Methylobacterium radiotolerans]